MGREEDTVPAAAAGGAGGGELQAWGGGAAGCRPGGAPQAGGRGLTSSVWSGLLSLRGRRSLRPFFWLGFLSAPRAQGMVSEASAAGESPSVHVLLNTCPTLSTPRLPAWGPPRDQRAYLGFIESWGPLLESCLSGPRP